MSDNDSLGFTIKEFGGKRMIHEYLRRDPMVTGNYPLEELSFMIRARVREFVKGLSKTACLEFLGISTDTDEWISDVEDPFGLDIDQNFSQAERKWYEDARASGICHTFFIEVFQDLAREKYKLPE